jgi:hypothetical protein
VDADLLVNQNKWASYEEYLEMLSNADEGDYDYSDFLFNGFFEGDSDIYKDQKYQLNFPKSKNKALLLIDCSKFATN